MTAEQLSNKCDGTFYFLSLFFLGLPSSLLGVKYTIALSKYPLVRAGCSPHPATIGGNTAHPIFLTVQVNVLALVYKTIK